VRHKPRSFATIVSEIANFITKDHKEECGIIYCLSQQNCEDMARNLKEKGISAVFYHAGMVDRLRSHTQSEWMRGASRVICATVAFGMGINKPDVRYVIHANMPRSIEAFYQVCHFSSFRVPVSFNFKSSMMNLKCYRAFYLAGIRSRGS